MTSPHQESGPAPVWEPDPAETEKSVLAAFTRRAEREHGIDLPDYDALWQWAAC
jgi:acetoacetyl-CoA synthetase